MEMNLVPSTISIGSARSANDMYYVSVRESDVSANYYLLLRHRARFDQINVDDQAQRSNRPNPSNMIKYIISVLCVASLAACAGNEVKHLIINQANLVETVAGYAINSPLLAQNNIKTVSVNGDQVVLVAMNCQRTVMSAQQLGPGAELLARARLELSTAETGQPRLSGAVPMRSGVAQFSLDDRSMSSSFQGRNMNSQSFSSNGWSMNKYDDQNLWMRSPNFPNNINRLLVSGDIVTFVYNTGNVQMKPIVCMQNDERALVQQVRSEVQRTQMQFNENMRQMQLNLDNNMRNMQNNLRQSMQQMQMQMIPNMQNMFAANMHNPFYDPTYAGSAFANVLDPTAATAYSGGPSAFAISGAGASDPFGSNFPFGPNNSPFGPGFPFNS